MSEELKPCPFCGAKPHRQLGKVWYDSDGDAQQDTVIKCPHLCVTMRDSADSVVKRWNARADLALQWQPIETAPTDTEILVFMYGEIYQARFDRWGRWAFPMANYHGCGCCSVDDDSPSHWMPMPDPPETNP